MIEKRTVNYKAEQEATLNRKPLDHGAVAKFLFWSMDLIYGKETSLPKVRLLEILARIPYQAWETRQYSRMTGQYSNNQAVEEAKDLIVWGRQAQDNEFWHLRTIEARMLKLNIRESWFWETLAARVAAIKYGLFSKTLAFFSLRTAFQLNAEFEDHAEHTYMQFVKDHPELDQQPVDCPVANEHPNGPFASWGDVFRQIALDERDHMNDSLVHCGKAGLVAPYLPG